MSEQAAVEHCQWHLEDRPSCRRDAILHVSWLWNSGYRQDKHLCEAHAAELREKPYEMQERPITNCGASCRIVVDATIRRVS